MTDVHTVAQELENMADAGVIQRTTGKYDHYSMAPNKRYDMGHNVEILVQGTGDRMEVKVFQWQDVDGDASSIVIQDEVHIGDLSLAADVIQRVNDGGEAL